MCWKEVWQGGEEEEREEKGARRATLDSPAVRLQADHASYSDIIY